MANRSYYCRKCEVLVDESEVDLDTMTHILIAVLTIAGETKELRHPVVPE